jgi:hypothetical protein
MIFIKYSYEFEIRVELAEVQDPSMIKNLWTKHLQIWLRIHVMLFERLFAEVLRNVVFVSFR